VAELRRLLEQGEDMGARDKLGDTPLHVAIQEGHTQAARLLIERGADPDARGSHWGPLTAAAVRGNVPIVRLLLARGADVNGRLHPGEQTVEYSPLGMACNREQFEAARALLEHGADVNLANRAGYTPLMNLKTDHLDFARLLIERGADPRARSEVARVNPELLKNLGMAT
jgi:ankyrin repeat protein